MLDRFTHALSRLDGADPTQMHPTTSGWEVEPVVVDTIADWLDDVLGRG